MEILYFVDLHGSNIALQNLLREVPRVAPDLLIIGGDITNFGSAEEASGILEKTATLGLPFYYVSGNCDPASIAASGVPGYEQQYVHGRVAEVGGVAICGISGAMPTIAHTPTELDDGEVGRVCSTLVSELKSRNYEHILLVSHCPPFNTQLDRTWVGIHAGSKSVRNFIEQGHPDVGLHGHIHEAIGMTKIGQSLLLNPGPARKGNYAMIRISNGDVSGRLQKFPQ